MENIYESTKIAKQMYDALLGEREMKSGDRRIIKINNEYVYYLYNTIIAKKTSNSDILVNVDIDDNPALDTHTSRSDTNTFLANSGYSVKVVKGEYCLFKDGKKIELPASGWVNAGKYL